MHTCCFGNLKRYVTKGYGVFQFVMGRYTYRGMGFKNCHFGRYVIIEGPKVFWKIMWREISKKGGKVLIYRGISNRKLMQTYRKISNISARLMFDFGTFFGLIFEWAYIRRVFFAWNLFFFWNLFPEFTYFLAHSFHFFWKTCLF